MNPINSRDILRAIYAGDTDKIDTFLSSGLDINTRTEGDNWNFLHRALVSVTQVPPPSIIRHFIKRGVDVNACDSRGWTPLHFAARTRNVSAMKMLLDGGADVDPVNGDGVTPLRLTLMAFPLSKEAVSLLLTRGANLDHEVKGGTVRKLALVLAHGENAWLKELVAD